MRLTPGDLTVTLPRSLKKLAAGFSLEGGYGRLIINAPDLETWYALDSTREMIYDNDYYENKLDPLAEVIPAGSPVTITWRRIIGSFELQIDGVVCGKLEAGDEIRITGSEKTVKLLRIRPYHFFSLLQNKLIEWGSRQ